MSSGRVFQSLGPAIANDRSPTVTSHDRGMTSSEEVDVMHIVLWNNAIISCHKILTVPVILMSIVSNWESNPGA